MPRRRTLSLLLALALLLGLPLGARADDPPDAPSAPPAGATSTSPVPETAGSEGPSEAERAGVKKMVDELRDEASRIRGLAWKRTVPADLLTRAQFRAKAEQMMEEEETPEDLQRDTRILRRMGLLAADEDPVALQLEMLEGMVAGYYNPKEKALYIVEGMTGDGQRPVILHELIHALEDQYVDLDARTERWKDDPDRLFAEQCLGEGSAEHARVMYQDTHPAIAAAYMQRQSDPAMAREQLRILRKVPAYMIVGTMLHYDVGPRLVAQVVGDDYPGGMAKLWDDGPVSEEEYLHPERWCTENKDYPETVVWGGDLATAAGEGWKKIQEASDGELDLTLYLDYFLGGTHGRLSLPLLMRGRYCCDRALAAGEGWDAGRALYLENGGRLAWIQTYAFDTVEDAGEASDAILDALRARDGDAFRATPAGAATTGDRVTDYTGAYGAGRLATRGAALFLVDGLDATTLDRVWSVLEKTRFEKDPRDRWDPSDRPDPLAQVSLANRSQGVGVSLAEGWTSQETTATSREALKFEKDGVLGVVVRQASPLPLDDALPLIEAGLGTQFTSFDVSKRVSIRVGANRGFKYEAGRLRGAPDDPSEAVLYLGEAAHAIAVVRFVGPSEALARLGTEMDSIAESLVFAAGTP